MKMVKFLPSGRKLSIKEGATLYEAALALGIPLRAECGGQGSCGQCVVKIEAGDCPPTPHPSIGHEQEQRGYRLACRARVRGDCLVFVPEESLLPPLEIDFSAVILSEDDLKRTHALRDTAQSLKGKRNTYGLAIDLGTTTVVAEIVALDTGDCLARAASYNRQLSCGTDIISRITCAERPGGRDRLRNLAMETINDLVAHLLERAPIDPARMIRATVAGNTTMIHLLLGLDPAWIRLESNNSALTRYPSRTAREAGLPINPNARVLFAPGVGGYVGGDVLAGVLACRMHETDDITLFIDAGTNGEVILGNREWMMGCACSTGPAFEGVGIACGMMAASGAIEDLRIVKADDPPGVETIGGAPPRGICGSGMIDLMAELFKNGMLDRRGALSDAKAFSRIEKRDGQLAYIVRRKGEEGASKEIFLTDVDLKKLIRTKAALQAAVSAMLRGVDLGADAINRIVIAGRLGEAIDAANAIAIGMLPDLPLPRFEYMGNGSLWGANLILLLEEKLQEINALADRVTYLDLSTHPGYMDEFIASLFIPHTDVVRGD